MKVKFLFAAALFLSVTTALSAQEAKYELKSAAIQKETVAMGQKFESTWYIDDFGKKESNEAVFKMGGVANIEKRILTIMEDASVVNVDLGLKSATRMKLPEKPINYLQLTPEVIEKYKIKEQGEEEIAGKPCKKYSLEVSQMGQTAQVDTWVWKGLVLKSQTSGNGMVVMVETAKEIQENAVVPAEKFMIPEGITIPE